MEVKMNKEIRDYTEKIFFGLTARQFFFSAGAAGIALLLYFFLKPYVGLETISWVCIVAACPFGILGFVKYNGLSAEKFLYIMFRFYFLEPKKLCSKPVNYYYEAWKISQKNKKGSKFGGKTKIKDQIRAEAVTAEESETDKNPTEAQTENPDKIKKQKKENKKWHLKLLIKS